MKSILLTAIFIVGIVMTTTAARPVHRLLSGDRYYVVYDNNDVMQYDVNKDTALNLTTNDNPFYSHQLTRVVAASPGEYVIVGALNNGDMPMWIYRFSSRRWDWFYDGKGGDSHFFCTPTKDYVIMAPVGVDNILKIDIRSGRTIELGKQP